LGRRESAALFCYPPAVGQDYLVAIGGTAFQVSIATVNGARFSG